MNKLKKYILYTTMCAFLGNTTACSTEQKTSETNGEIENDFDVVNFSKTVKELFEKYNLDSSDFGKYLVNQPQLTVGTPSFEVQKTMNKYNITIEDLEKGLENESVPFIKGSKRDFIEREILSSSYIDKINMNYQKAGEDNRNYIENYYGEYIDSVTYTYGIDTNLLKAIYSQEFGIATNNIGQIEKKAWYGQKVTAYNFEIGDYETIKINDTCFSDPYQSMLLQMEIYSLKGHILAGIQGYNYNSQVVKKCIERYARDNGLTVDEILNDQTNLNWLNYVKNYKNGEYGDPNYISNVLSHIEADDYTLCIQLPDGNLKNIEIINEPQKVHTK